jgi:hypothetical protein
MPIREISIYKLKFYLFANLCSTFRKCSVDSIESRHIVDATSVWWRMCTVWWQHKQALTLVPDQAMLLG